MMGFPQYIVRDIDHPSPIFGIGEMFLPIRTQVLGVDAVKFGRCPCFGMDAVRNAGDGYFLNGDSRPDILPKPATYLAVKLAHTIGVTAYAKRENGHTERVGSVNHRLPESE